MGSDVKMYGRRFMKRSLDREIRFRSESRDAIIWDIDLDERICRVKIQGSNELITAWFPENWQQSPVFIKKGNAVRVAHVGGERSRIEIVGWGLRLPTPVAGGFMPSLAAGGDYWITGGGIEPTATESMSVIAEAGQAYIAGHAYDFTFDEVLGGDMVLGDGIILGSGSAILTVDPPPDYVPSQWWGDVAMYRYDVFTVGVDGVIDYVKGEETVLTMPIIPPVKPAIEGNHLILGGYILVYSGMTEIVKSDIGRDFRQPAPYRLKLKVGFEYLDSGDEFLHPWTPNHAYPPDYIPTPTPVDIGLTVTMFDQYGNPVPRPGGGNYEFVFEFLGWMDGNGTWQDDTLDPQVRYGATSGVQVAVRRRNSVGDVGNNALYADDLSPSLKVSCSYNGIDYYVMNRIVYLDEYGVPMPPSLVL